MEDAVRAIRARDVRRPRVGVVLGSGLGALAGALTEGTSFPYDAIPGMPPATVPGHAGRLVIGTVAGTPCAALQGRAHFYEGYGMGEVTFGVRLLRALGVQTLILTNASGGLNPEFHPGDLMLIRDHIFLPGMAGVHPLRGANDERLGPRFPAMVGAYDPALRHIAHGVAAGLSFALREGVYVMVSGPSYETSAELRFLRAAGADAVGMSTCPEAVAARHAGMRLLGISLIANLALADQPEVLTHETVVDASQKSAAAMAALLAGVIPLL